MGEDEEFKAELSTPLSFTIFNFLFFKLGSTRNKTKNGYI